MPSPRLIALYGDMRGGKDTVGGYLRTRYGYTQIAFGDALREVVYTMYPDAKTERVEYRRRMQDIGQHMRSYDPDVWVREHARRANAALTRGESVVVTDLRQPNEYDAMRRAGAFIVRVTCPLEIRVERAGAEAAYMNHETEKHFDQYTPDAVLANDGTLDALYRQVDALMGGP